MSDLITAIKIACEAHANQKDKAGEPYILHPLRLMQRFKNTDYMIVAVLHDVIEDSQFDLAFLETEGFDINILMAVDALTKRGGEDYQGFIERLAFNSTAVEVKIEDLKDQFRFDKVVKCQRL